MLIGTPHVFPDLGLHLHHLVELGQRHALGVVRVDGVDRRALLAQPIGEQYLADVHVDATDECLDLGVGITDVDARVDVRIGQLFVVEDLFEVVGKLLVAASRQRERLLDLVAPARIVVDAHAHRGVVDLTKFHGRPFARRLSVCR